MKVPLNIPDKAWADLVKIAEDHGTTVPLFIEAAIRDAVRPSHLTKLRADARRRAVLAAYRDGLTDAAIAERTGEVRGYVAEIRRAAGLQPHTLRDRGLAREKTPA